MAKAAKFRWRREVCREYGQMQREAGVYRGQMTDRRATT